MIGGSPDQVPEKYASRSPIRHLERIEGSVLIVQGALDPNVAPAQMEAAMTKMREHGIPFEVLVFEDEGHGILKQTNQERLYPIIADFFDQSLKPRAE